MRGKMEKTKLSDLQQVQVEMLQKVVNICEENGITYWLGDGSLLGGCVTRDLSHGMTILMF